MALKTLTSARTAIESAKGTPVTATRILYFAEGVHSQEVPTIAPPELRASYRPSFRAYPGVEHDSFTFSGDATYGDLPFWLSSAVKGGITGSGGSADKTWTITPSNTADDVKAFTLEFAYTDLAATVMWKVPGCQVDTFSLSYVKGEAVTYEATVKSFAAATQGTAFTGSLSDRANVSLIGTGTTVYVDTTTLGSTADSNIVDATWTLENGLVAREPLNGTNTGTALVRPEPVKWNLEVTRYFEDKTELDTYLAKTERKVRIRTLGPALGTSAYRFDLNLYGYWDTTETADVDGLIVAKLNLLPIYDSVASGDFAMTLVNGDTAVT